MASARDEGVIRSFLTPLDKPFAMVAACDVGHTAAALIRERWRGVRVIRLEGPARVSPNDLAAAFAEVLGRPVHAEIVPHDGWDSLFRSQGMHNPKPRIRMLDGFNEGWIDFPRQDREVLKGSTNAASVIKNLARREAWQLKHLSHQISP